MLRRLLLIAVVAAAGCGSSDGGNGSPGCEPDSCDDPAGYESGEACSGSGSCLCEKCPTYCDALCPFSLPNADVVAYLEEDEGRGPPTELDLDCLGANELPAAPAQDVTMTGIVEDFEDAYPIEGATVEVFASALDLDTPIASTVSGELGAYTIVIPAAELAVARVSWRVAAEDRLETLHLNQAIECRIAPCVMNESRLSVSWVTLDSVVAILGTSRPAGTSTVIGDVLDCDRNSLANANGRLLSVSGDRFSDAEIYYFEEEFPVRRRLQPWSSSDGLVAFLNVQSTDTVEIQAYGRVDGAETLLSSATVFPTPDAVVITDMDPLGPR